MDFRVELVMFRGPLDLLLYLVRKHELDILDIPIAQVTDQFLEHLKILEQLDVNAVGDFLEMASTLVEIKSRLVLPHGDEVQEEIEDPRRELVEQLLEYKRFKDAASMLDERGRWWQERYPRFGNDRAARERNWAEEPLRELELWDLVSAFGRIMRERQDAAASSIVYDDTPLHVYMERIHNLLATTGHVALSELFVRGMHKSALVGIFLAVLELVRHHDVRAEQNDTFGEIWLLPGTQFQEQFDLAALESAPTEPPDEAVDQSPVAAAPPADEPEPSETVAETESPSDARSDVPVAEAEPQGSPVSTPSPKRRRRRDQG
jgi:segregation and condensation protein A